MECACGCGRNVKLTRRGVNKNVERVARMLTQLRQEQEMVRATTLNSSEEHAVVERGFGRLIDLGDDLYLDMTDYVHGDAEAPSGFDFQLWWKHSEAWLLGSDPRNLDLYLAVLHGEYP